MTTKNTFTIPVLPLDSGRQLHDVTIAYASWGALNEAKDNVIWLCHALTGDQYAANNRDGTFPTNHSGNNKPGWWHLVVGPGKVIDTNKFFVVCSNVLGGCSGSTGPSSINPETGTPYNLDFPSITIADMVRAQAALLESLGIDRVKAVVGASMGGMQALQWAVDYPEKMDAVVALACSYRHTAQNIAFHEIGRQAIMADPDWHKGNYLAEEAKPTGGLSVARMMAHVTYMSEKALADKFGRNLQDRQAISYGFNADFQVESYLRYQGSSFVNRFDANSYLYITRAVDYFDLAPGGNKLASVFDPSLKYCLISLSTDWLFPTAEHKVIVKALNSLAARVSFVEISTDKGHDGFLHQEPELHATLGGFMGSL